MNAPIFPPRSLFFGLVALATLAIAIMHAPAASATPIDRLWITNDGLMEYLLYSPPFPPVYDATTAGGATRLETAGPGSTDFCLAVPADQHGCGYWLLLEPNSDDAASAGYPQLPNGRYVGDIVVAAGFAPIPLSIGRIGLPAGTLIDGPRVALISAEDPQFADYLAVALGNIYGYGYPTKTGSPVALPSPVYDGQGFELWVDASPVPEPTTALLLAAGLAWLARRKRRVAFT